MNFSDKNYALSAITVAPLASMEGVGKRYSRWRSWGFDNFLKSVNRMKKAQVLTVIQITLSAKYRRTLRWWISCYPHLYSVISWLTKMLAAELPLQITRNH